MNRFVLSQKISVILSQCRRFLPVFGMTCSLFLMSFNSFAESGSAYLTKFITYTKWCQNLPNSPTPEFLEFINNPSPLTHKLREKWLYQLARNHDWATYHQYYQYSKDTYLQCYEQTALYKLGKIDEARQGMTVLWLNGGSQPKACDELFSALLRDHQISDQLIHARIGLALEKRNLSLARYLLKQLNPPHLQDAELLTQIHQSPTRILQLQPGGLHGKFYLYGLKQMVPRQLDQAIKIWQNPKSKSIMNEAEQQAFLSYVALYKAMRNQDDAPQWFAKIKSDYYNDALMDWEIRYALLHKNWHKIIYLINHAKNKDEPGWQYWLARAYDESHEKEKAREIYQQLGSKRNYYGFLASIKLNKKLHFENEPINHDMQTLTVYKPIIDQVKDLYNSRQAWLASRLLNDFSSELPKQEKSALAYWVASDLNWNGKAVYLSNNEELNNQLGLRFPLAHRTVIHDYAHHYQIAQPLVYAMIRQESMFFEDIVSSAGANGLMQIMPVTAKVVAKREKIVYSNPKELFTSQKNINIGIAYLKQLAQQFRAHPVLMAAAYNAGPRQVNYWLKNHPPQEIDIWIDTLPWQETRNYLKNVIAFYAVYQYRLQEKPNLDAFMKPFH